MRVEFNLFLTEMEYDKPLKIVEGVCAIHLLQQCCLA